tara:strand:+ start:593 stop:1093 length:501 start_codon:yes stop_codon:yes gene_type:complete
MKNFIITFSLIFTLLSCTNQQTSKPKTVGFSVFEPGVSWATGSNKSIDIWKNWCNHHMSEDLDAIMNLAADSIAVNGPYGEKINGKDQLGTFLTNWFASNNLKFDHQWATSVTNPDGDGGEWVLNGYNFEVSNDTVTNTVNHFAGAYIKNGLVHQFSIYEQQLPKE